MARRKQGFETLDVEQPESQPTQECDAPFVETDSPEQSRVTEISKELEIQEPAPATSEPEPAPTLPLPEKRVARKARKVAPVLPARKGGFAEGRKPRNVPKFS